MNMSCKRGHFVLRTDVVKSYMHGEFGDCVQPLAGERQTERWQVGIFRERGRAGDWIVFVWQTAGHRVGRLAGYSQRWAERSREGANNQIPETAALLSGFFDSGPVG